MLDVTLGCTVHVCADGIKNNCGTYMYSSFTNVLSGESPVEVFYKPYEWDAKFLPAVITYKQRYRLYMSVQTGWRILVVVYHNFSEKYRWGVLLWKWIMILPAVIYNQCCKFGLYTKSYTYMHSFADGIKESSSQLSLRKCAVQVVCVVNEYDANLLPAVIYNRYTVITMG